MSGRISRRRRAGPWRRGQLVSGHGQPLGPRRSPPGRSMRSSLGGWAARARGQGAPRVGEQSPRPSVAMLPGEKVYRVSWSGPESQSPRWAGAEGAGLRGLFGGAGSRAGGALGRREEPGKRGGGPGSPPEGCSTMVTSSLRGRPANPGPVSVLRDRSASVLRDSPHPQACPSAGPLAQAQTPFSRSPALSQPTLILTRGTRVQLGNTTSCSLPHWATWNGCASV